MACPFYYMRPDEIWSFDGTVTGGVDTDYLAAWVADRRVGRPARSNASTFSYTISNPSGEVGMVVVANHNLDLGATINVFSTSFTVSTEARPDGIPLSPFFIRTPANTTTLTVASSTAQANVPVIGEIFAGKYRTLPRSLRLADAEFEHHQYGIDPQAEFASIQPYDKGMASRTLVGSVVVTSSEFADLRGWYEAQRGFSKPSVIVPDGSVKDAWVVRLNTFSYRKHDESLHEVRLEFTEYPRSRW